MHLVEKYILQLFPSLGVVLNFPPNFRLVFFYTCSYKEKCIRTCPIAASLGVLIYGAQALKFPALGSYKNWFFMRVSTIYRYTFSR